MPKTVTNVIQGAMRRIGMIVEEEGISVSANAAATARMVITDAFHRLGLISEDEGITASQTTRGLSVLNDMMSSWASEGIAYTHTALALTDPLTVPAFLVKNVEMTFCVDLGREYGVQIAPDRLAEFAQYKVGIAAHYSKIQRGLTLLSDILQGFESEGIQYVPDSSISLTATINFPDFLVRNLEWVLADDMASEAGQDVTPNQQEKMVQARTTLQAFFFRVPKAKTDDGVLNRHGLGGTLTTTSIV